MMHYCFLLLLLLVATSTAKLNLHPYAPESMPGDATYTFDVSRNGTLLGLEYGTIDSVGCVAAFFQHGFIVFWQITGTVLMSREMEMKQLLTAGFHNDIVFFATESAVVFLYPAAQPFKYTVPNNTHIVLAVVGNDFNEMFILVKESSGATNNCSLFLVIAAGAQLLAQLLDVQPEWGMVVFRTTVVLMSEGQLVGVDIATRKTTFRVQPPERSRNMGTLATPELFFAVSRTHVFQYNASGAEVCNYTQVGMEIVAVDILDSMMIIAFCNIMSGVDKEASSTLGENVLFAAVHLPGPGLRALSLSPSGYTVSRAASPPFHKPAALWYQDNNTANFFLLSAEESWISHAWPSSHFQAPPSFVAVEQLYLVVQPHDSSWVCFLGAADGHLHFCYNQSSGTRPIVAVAGAFPPVIVTSSGMVCGLSYPKIVHYAVVNSTMKEIAREGGAVLASASQTRLIAVLRQDSIALLDRANSYAAHCAPVKIPPFQQVLYFGFEGQMLHVATNTSAMLIKVSPLPSSNTSCTVVANWTWEHGFKHAFPINESALLLFSLNESGCIGIATLVASSGNQPPNNIPHRANVSVCGAAEQPPAYLADGGKSVCIFSLKDRLLMVDTSSGETNKTYPIGATWGPASMSKRREHLFGDCGGTLHRMNIFGERKVYSTNVPGAVTDVYLSEDESVVSVRVAAEGTAFFGFNLSSGELLYDAYNKSKQNTTLIAQSALGSQTSVVPSVWDLWLYDSLGHLVALNVATGKYSETMAPSLLSHSPPTAVLRSESGVVIQQNVSSGNASFVCRVEPYPAMVPLCMYPAPLAPLVGAEYYRATHSVVFAFANGKIAEINPPTTTSTPSPTLTTTSTNTHMSTSRTLTPMPTPSSNTGALLILVSVSISVVAVVVAGVTIVIRRRYTFCGYSPSPRDRLLDHGESGVRIVPLRSTPINYAERQPQRGSSF